MRRMTTIAIVPDNPGSPTTNYRAVAGANQATGKTAGAALDALTAQLGELDSTTLVVLQQARPDRFFTAEQQKRLEELMARWRTARDAGQSLPPEEQAELDALVLAELQAATERARDLVQPAP
jgi:hypothetical protein